MGLFEDVLPYLVGLAIFTFILYKIGVLQWLLKKI